MHIHSDELVRALAIQAQRTRIEVLKMVYNAQTGHIGGAFSAAEILAALYFHHLRIDPDRPDWPERDRFLFSKGHACAVLYSALANRGFFPVEELMTFRKLDSRLQGHPDPHKCRASRSPPARWGTAWPLARGWRWRNAGPRSRPRERAIGAGFGGRSTSCWAMGRSTPG